MGDPYVTATHPALNSVCCYTLGGKPPCPKKKGYYKSVRGGGGEQPLEALGSPPHTDKGSYLYSGPPTDLADTVSLTRRPRGPARRPELQTTSRNPEVCPAYVKDSHLPEQTYGALDRTAEHWPNYWLGPKIQI